MEASSLERLEIGSCELRSWDVTPLSVARRWAGPEPSQRQAALPRRLAVPGRKGEAIQQMPRSCHLH
eukprot:757590-Pyramimonas_sp.AAC.1